MEYGLDTFLNVSSIFFLASRSNDVRIRYRNAPSNVSGCSSTGYENLSNSEKIKKKEIGILFHQVKAIINTCIL